MAQYIHPYAASSTKASVPSFPVDDSDRNPTFIPTSQLLSPDVKHTFLIRNPQKAIPSYYRLCYPGAPTGFDQYDPEEAGYKELKVLFDFLRAKGQTPLILDSDDLLSEPEKVMKRWCEDVEIEYDSSMLGWGEGTREHFAKWPGWHTSAENSQGIGKGLKSEHCTPSNHNSDSDTPEKKVKEKKEKPAHPQIVIDSIEENLPIYEYLSQFVTRP